MTYIEFFDKSSIENICGCLTNTPEKVIYIGKNKKLMAKYISCYEKVLSERGKSVELSFTTVNTNSLESIVKLLSEIVESENECAFDLTGGDDLTLVAMGIVYTKYPEKNIQMHRFNIRNSTIVDCDQDGITIQKEVPALTVEENIRIYGGDIVYSDQKPNSTYRWQCDDEFQKDINNIWDVCKTDVRLWNVQISVLKAAEQVRHNNEDEDEDEDRQLTTEVSVNEISNYLKNKDFKFVFIKSIFKRLSKYGLITAYNCNDEVFSIKYKNRQVKRCLTKAGQALEMKFFITAKDVADVDGKPLFSDIMNGVYIDWDGDIHDADSHCAETENEIDIIMMKNTNPIFVSCKNGHVDVEELYKLNTVADRFGGKYAKKVLVINGLDSSGEFGNYFRQRAEDMDIRLIENIQGMRDDELAKKIRQLWYN